MAWKRCSACPALAAALLSLALYAITLGGTYVYDDVQIITLDERISTPSEWGQIWTHDYFNGAIDNLYRPLVTQSFALQWWLHGDRPWAFHLVNILLNAAVAAAVAELARRLGGITCAYIAGLLFAAHPVHVEAVAEIVGRTDEMCALFMLLALILFLRRPLTASRAMAVVACCIAATLSKEQGMLTPAILLALAWLTHRRAQSPREKTAMQYLALGCCWSLAGLIVLREEVLKLRFEWEPRFLDLATQPLIHSGPADHALMVFVLLGRYAQLLIAPVRLSIDYGLSVLTPIADPHDPYLYVGLLIAVAGIAALILALRYRQWVAAFCLIAAGLCYGMVSNVFLIGAIFGERMLYLPSAFLVIGLSIYLARLKPNVLASLLAILILLGSVRTVTYAARWNDRFEFYNISLAEQPKSVRLAELVATDLMDRGDLNQAAAVAAEGCRAAPDYWNIWLCAGRIAEKEGDLKEADALYHTAFKLQQTVSLDTMIRKLEKRLRESGPNGTKATQPVN